MKKISKKQKLMILISIFTIVVIIGLVIGINAIKVNILNEKYNSSNSSSSNGNLLPEYIKEGITLAGVTGTLEVLDTSDATATPEDILYGKTAYVDGKKITGTYRTIGMCKVGDYIEYIPDTTINSYDVSGIYSGYTSNQTILKENLVWRVLSINNDGTVDLISTKMTGNIYFGGAVGYNNGVYLLNDIVNKLYTNSKIGASARNINFNDIKKHMSNKGLEIINNCVSYAGVKIGQTKVYTDEIYRNYPSLYAKENGSGINTTVVKNDGINQSDSYYTSPTTEAYSQAGQIGLTVTQNFYASNVQPNYFDNEVFYDLIFNVNNYYWLSTRFVDTYSNHAMFGISCIGKDAISGGGLAGSYISNVVNYNYSLRPIVSLKSNTKLGSGDGKDASTAYQIID